MWTIIVISSKAFLNFLVFLTSFHFCCIMSIHHQKHAAALLSDLGDNLFLGLNLILLSVIYLLLVSSSWNCIVVPENRQSSLKYPINQCNIHFFFSFFFLFKENRKSWQGFWQCARKKANCVGFGEMNCAIKTTIMQELMCNLVTIKKGSCWARRMISDFFAYIRDELHRKKSLCIGCSTTSFCKLSLDPKIWSENNEIGVCITPGTNYRLLNT